MQRCKETKRAKWVAQSKQGKHNIIAWSGGRYASSTPTSQRCVSEAVTSKHATRETDAAKHKQVALKTNKLKPTEGQAWQNLDLGKQTWI